MKKIEDYTESELINLTTEEVERIIKLHLVDEGIKLVKKPEEPKLHKLPEKDLVGYTVPNVSFVFEKKETAEEIATILRNNFSNLKSISSSWYDSTSIETLINLDSYYFRDGVNSIQVQEKKYYSADLYSQIGNKISENKKLSESYREEKKIYDEVQQSSSETVSYVWDIVNKAKENQEKREKMLGIFKEYLELSDSNKDVAWKFMNKAYSLTEDIINYINKNIK
jgi:hypothetical protein